MIEHTRWTLRTTVPAADVAKALIDFGPSRSRIWKETSHPQVYAVHRLSATSAEVTEGVPFAWSRERYDWSEPGRIVLDQLDSNVAKPGGRIEYTITPTAGGCIISCDRRRDFRRSPRGLLAGTVMRLVGAALLRHQFDVSLRRLSSASA